MQSAVKVSHSYFPSFDLFRGIGILFVILAHIPTDNRTIGSLRPIGALGVHMFFALSGFLITYRLVEEHEQTGRIDLKAFYLRRAWRILPPAVIYLATLTLLGPGGRVLPTSLSEIVACLFFYRNLSQPPMPGSWYTSHFWSLSLEEQFYLVWPLLLVIFVPKRNQASIAAICIITATILWRIYVQSTNPGANIYRPDLLADHLLWGCLIGLRWKQICSWFSRRLRTVLGFSGIFAAALLIYQQPRYWQPLFAFCVAVGFILSAEAMQSVAKKCVPLQTLGKASYDCYIWQSLFLPLPFFGTNLPFVQRVPWSFLLIALITTGSFLLTFPRQRMKQDSFHRSSKKLPLIS